MNKYVKEFKKNLSKDLSKDKDEIILSIYEENFDIDMDYEDEEKHIEIISIKDNYYIINGKKRFLIDSRIKNKKDLNEKIVILSHMEHIIHRMNELEDIQIELPTKLSQYKEYGNLKRQCYKYIEERLSKSPKGKINRINSLTHSLNDIAILELILKSEKLISREILFRKDQFKGIFFTVNSKDCDMKPYLSDIQLVFDKKILNDFDYYVNEMNEFGIPDENTLWNNVNNICDFVSCELVIQKDIPLKYLKQIIFKDKYYLDKFKRLDIKQKYKNIMI